MFLQHKTGFPLLETISSTNSITFLNLNTVFCTEHVFSATKHQVSTLYNTQIRNRTTGTQNNYQTTIGRSMQEKGAAVVENCTPLCQNTAVHYAKKGSHSTSPH